MFQDLSTSLSQIWCESVQYWRSYRPLTDYEMVATAMVDCGRSEFCAGIEFSSSISNLVQIRSKMAELWPFIWFQNDGRRHLGFCGISKLLVKPVMGPHFLSLCQIWCESVQKWPSYCRLTGFKTAAAAILDFWPSFQPTYEIWCRYMQKWPICGQKCDFQYGGRRHLEFCGISILPIKSVMGPHFLSLCQIWCKSVQKWSSYCRLTDFKMTLIAMLDFWPMWILMVNRAAGPHFQHMYQIRCKYMFKNGRLMAISVIFNMAAAAILDFVRYQFWQ